MDALAVAAGAADVETSAAATDVEALAVAAAVGVETFVGAAGTGALAVAAAVGVETFVGTAGAGGGEDTRGVRGGLLETSCGGI